MSPFTFIPSIGVVVQQVLQSALTSLFIHYSSTITSSFLSTEPTAHCWRGTVCEKRSASFNGPWDLYIYSPSSRIVTPLNILAPNHTILSAYPGPASLITDNPLIIYDFGKEVGGIITLNYTASGSGLLGLAFSEARNWTGGASDGSNGSYRPGGDGALLISVSESGYGNYEMPDASLRGGFRYVSVFSSTDSELDVNITAVSLEIAFQPTWSDLRTYGGYFYSNDDLLNRIWYAGAYTLQTNAVPPNTGREYPLLDYGWRNDVSLGTNGSSIFVDGSKRDRATWSGDLGVALPSTFVSTGDYESAKNALQLQYDLQKPDGELLMAGPPINYYGSDTYHMSSIIGTYEYILYSADMKFLTSNWAAIKLAMTFIIAKIDDTGLLYVTGRQDWGRSKPDGHNTAANALLYRTLITGSSMANWINDPALAKNWTSQAETLKTVINTAANWDPKNGAYRDNDVDCLFHPQDGNSLALYYNMSLPSRARNISTHLLTNWSPIGAVSPEMKDNISPFISSLEIKAHLSASQPMRALELIRRSWGWYLDHPYGTGSTCIEGYLADGTFGYRKEAGYQGDASYTSHAHGWSTGPTSALSTGVLGLQMLRPGGKEWALSPQFGDLEWVRGGYTTPLGKFSAGWNRKMGGYEVNLDVPHGTSGTLIFPVDGTNTPKLKIDGRPFRAFTHDTSSNTLTISNQEGGRHAIIVSY